ncbi:Flagellar biosynthetic protein FliQ [Chlamydiales bacterium SCGC AG-110-P3]|nr:Flagellar biosynthetic protein FliQ [Chlamydiales bacterium SCGC AG-110-P3]
MTPDQVTDIIRGALFVAIQVTSPLLIIAMVIGFGISLFQSVTQINEMTLTFVPKILIFAIALGIFFPWILKTLVQYTLTLLQYHWDTIITTTQYAQ